MDIASLLVAVLVGILQGIFEWLPISSEGNLTIVLAALGYPAGQAVRYALFLHLGTALAATAYYRSDLRTLLEGLPTAVSEFREQSEVWFLAIATLVSGVTGIAAYGVLIETVSKLGGGLLILAIGVLLVGTGFFQRYSTNSLSAKDEPTLRDAVLVGVGQGVAVLPGVSRSGTTVGIMLLRGYEGPLAFRLSFILSIPAALGAGVLVLAETGTLTGVSPLAGSVAVAVSGVVGYATIDILMRLVERVAFWLICVLLGLVAVLGGGIIIF